MTPLYIGILLQDTPLTKKEIKEAYLYHNELEIDIGRLNILEDNSLMIENRDIIFKPFTLRAGKYERQKMSDPNTVIFSIPIRDLLLCITDLDERGEIIREVSLLYNCEITKINLELYITPNLPLLFEKKEYNVRRYLPLVKQSLLGKKINNLQ